MNNPYQSPDSLSKATINTPDAIRSKIKGAVVSGAIVSVLTLLIATFALVKNTSFAGIDGSSIIDGLIYAALTFGIYRKSRASAIIIFTIYLVSKLYIWFSLGQPKGLLISMILLYYFFRGIVGTYQYHSFMTAQDESHKTTSKWMPWFFIPTGIIFLVLAVIGVLSEIGIIVPTDVIAGKDMPEEYIEILKENSIINQQEQVILFYSEGLESILEGGNLLTDSRVISYESVDSDLTIYSSLYENVFSAELEIKGSFLEDSYILVTKSDQSSFYVIASIEDNGDVRFIEQLKEKMNQNRESQKKNDIVH